MACTNCQTEVVAALLEAKADLRSTSETGQTCLHKAASVGKFELLKMITDAAAAKSPDVLDEVSRLLDEVGRRFSDRNKLVRLKFF